jgi:hypothetical protein
VRHDSVWRSRGLAASPRPRRHHAPPIMRTRNCFASAPLPPAPLRLGRSPLPEVRTPLSPSPCPCGNEEQRQERKRMFSFDMIELQCVCRQKECVYGVCVYQLRSVTFLNPQTPPPPPPPPRPPTPPVSSPLHPASGAADAPLPLDEFFFIHFVTIALLHALAHGHRVVGVDVDHQEAKDHF